MSFLLPCFPHHMCACRISAVSLHIIFELSHGLLTDVCAAARSRAARGTRCC